MEDDTRMEDDGFDDLYGDLDEIRKSAQVVRLTDKVAELTKSNETLATELLETKQQLELLVNEKAVVERNMMLLFNTAQREIERKDKQIADLLASSSSSSSSFSNKRSYNTTTAVLGGPTHSTSLTDTTIPQYQPPPAIKIEPSNTTNSGGTYCSTGIATLAHQPPPLPPPLPPAPPAYAPTNYTPCLQPPPPP